jgi:hypothetical protein
MSQHEPFGATAERIDGLADRADVDRAHLIEPGKAE